MKRFSRNLIFLFAVKCLVAASAANAIAHPVSHTDAWVKVSKTIDVRLNVFLDDVLRHQGQLPQASSTVPRDVVKEAIAAHGQLLLKQLSIFDSKGVLLTGVVVEEPSWKSGDETVDLEADSSLKFAWKLRYTPIASVPIRQLLFLHELTHESLQQTGELRLHVQDVASGRRVDAVIPAQQPHTIFLPESGRPAAASQLDANSLSSRIVVGPTQINVEFIGPVLRMDVALPIVAKTKRESSFHSGSFAELAWNLADQESAKQACRTWAMQNLVTDVNGVQLDPKACVVEFFQTGSDLKSAASGETTPELLPLIGTSVGVRLSYPRGISVSRIDVRMKRPPGTFEETNTTICRFGKRSSSLQTLQDSNNDEDSFQFEWVLAEEGQGSVAETLSVNPGKLISSRKIYPGTVGGLAMVFVGLTFFAFWTLSTKKQAATTVAAFLLCLGVAATQFASHSYTADNAMLSEVIHHRISSIYNALQLNDEQQCVNSLFEILDDDMLEEIYLSAVDTLNSDPGEPLSMIRSIVMEKCVTDRVLNTTELVADCEWTVSGTVEHWGHSHDRGLQLKGTVGLIFDGERWKIGSFQATGLPQPDL